MGNRAYTNYSTSVRAVGYSRQARASQKCFDFSQDLDELVSAASNLDRLGEIEGVMRRMNYADRGDHDCAVYAAEAVGFGHVKIGVSSTPIKRLEVLQIANFADLKLVGLVWASSEKAAANIERLALRAAKEMEWKANGEWVKSTAEEAIELIVKAARFADARVYGTPEAMANMVARANALADMKASQAA